MLPIFVGDVHGCFKEYKDMTNRFERTIQLGDMGIGFDNDESVFSNINSKQHKFIRGNHDNPKKVDDYCHYLGNYGIIDDIYYFSGGYSIDRYSRTEGKNWWPEEELNYSESYKAYKIYNENKPDIVCSHECPKCVINFLKNDDNIISSTTSKTLDFLFEIYQPKFWLFGHHHTNKEFIYKNTHFVAVNTLCLYNLNLMKFI